MLLQRAIDIASLNPKPLSINFYIKVKIHWTCRWGDNPRHKFENFWWCTVTPLYLNSETKRLTWKRTLNRLGYKIRKHKFLLQTQILLPASNFPPNVDEFKELNVSPGDFYCSGPIDKVLNPKPWAHSDGNLWEGEPVTRSRPDCGLGPQQTRLWEGLPNVNVETSSPLPWRQRRFRRVAMAREWCGAWATVADIRHNIALSCIALTPPPRTNLPTTFNCRQSQMRLW